jgi:hypothetical protein
VEDLAHGGAAGEQVFAGGADVVHGEDKAVGRLIIPLDAPPRPYPASAIILLRLEAVRLAAVEGESPNTKI